MTVSSIARRSGAALVLAGAALPLGLATASASTPHAYDQTTTAVHVRAGAGTQYTVLGTLPKGATFSPGAISLHGWQAFTYHGRVGWVSQAYVRMHVR